MSYRNMHKWLLAAAACVFLGTAVAQENAPAPNNNAEEVTLDKGDQNAAKKALSQLRGKLLYKKGQIRKLEKAATDADAALAGKIAELERQRRELLVAAQAKLAALYEENDNLEKQIQAAAAKK